jgi:hypothetical protein
MLTALTVLFLLCPVEVYKDGGSYLDMEEEYWILEVPRTQLYLNRDCAILNGKYT